MGIELLYVFWNIWNYKSIQTMENGREGKRWKIETNKSNRNNRGNRIRLKKTINSIFRVDWKMLAFLEFMLHLYLQSFFSSFRCFHYNTIFLLLIYAIRITKKVVFVEFLLISCHVCILNISVSYRTASLFVYGECVVRTTSFVSIYHIVTMDIALT